MLEQIIETILSTALGLVDTIIEFIPSLILGLIVFGIGYVLSRILRSIVQNIAEKFKLDKFVESLGFTEGLKRVNIKQPPSVILATVVYWLILLNFLLAALQKMQFGTIVLPLQQFISKFPAFIAAFITLSLGAMLARVAGRFVSGALSGIGLEIHEVLGNIVRYLILCIVFIIALQQIGFDVDLLKNLFSTTLLILIAGVALSFGLGGNSVTRNVLAGFYAREIFKIGDILMIDGEEGVLEGIGKINSELRTSNGLTSIANCRFTDETIKKIE